MKIRNLDVFYIERCYLKSNKEEIFELYVNRIFLGNRSYGIEAASNTYFDKGLEDLTISESATIAALAQLPSRVNPVKDKRRTTGFTTTTAVDRSRFASIKRVKN